MIQPRKANPKHHRKSREGRKRGDDPLALWLEAEALGEEAHSERALLELLAHLPEATPAPKIARNFAERVINRIERDARSKNRWSVKNAVTLLAGSVLACWVGAIAYAGLLGVDPMRISSTGRLVGDAARAILSAPKALVDVLVASGTLVQDAQAATAWAYSPWCLGLALASLVVAAGALRGLDRRHPRPRQHAACDASTLGAA